MHPIAATSGGEELSLRREQETVRQYPRRDAAGDFARQRVAASIAPTDASKLIYQLGALRNYTPSTRLAQITVPTTWINAADDLINPRNLDFQ